MGSTRLGNAFEIIFVLNTLSASKSRTYVSNSSRGDDVRHLSLLAKAEARHVHVMRDYRVASGGRIHRRWPGTPLTLSGLYHHHLRWGPYSPYQSNLLRPIYLCLHNMRNNNIEVFIQSGRRTLPEYQVEVVDDKTVACYIPSEAGKVRPSAR